MSRASAPVDVTLASVFRHGFEVSIMMFGNYPICRIMLAVIRCLMLSENQHDGKPRNRIL